MTATVLTLVPYGSQAGYNWALPTLGMDVTAYQASIPVYPANTAQVPTLAEFNELKSTVETLQRELKSLRATK